MQASLVEGGVTNDFFWQNSRGFSDPARWQGQGQSKPTSRHPDSKAHAIIEVALWLNAEQEFADVETPPLFQPIVVHGEDSRPAHESALEVRMCRKMFEDGRTTEAVEELNLLVQRGCHVPNNLFYRVLRKCIEQKDLNLGRRIHALSARSGYEGDPFLATHLISLYSSHGRLEEALGVFTKVSKPDGHVWATIIMAYAKHGKAAHAIRLYRQMLESTMEPDNRVYSAVLKACATARDLVTGKEVHAHILSSPGKPDIFVQNGLVHMYAKCKSLEAARLVFDSLTDRNMVTWNTMIAGYAQQGKGAEALDLYHDMQQEGLLPQSPVTFVCLLQACASIGAAALHEGKQLHAQIDEQGLHQDVILGGSLVNMYAKCGTVDDARLVFDRLSDRNVVTWTAMIVGYVQQGKGEDALSLFWSMQREGVSSPDAVMYVCLLQACASIGVGALQQGKQLHAQIEEHRLQDDVVVGGSLVNMYAKCGSVEDARHVFDRLPARNIVTWTAMIAGYSHQGMGEEALVLYSSMQEEGMSPPNSVTFVCLLQACASVGVKALHQGKQLHRDIEEQGLQDDVALGCSLVNMYAKCGSLEDARGVFDKLPETSLVTWNAMLAGYAQQELGQEALSLYRRMEQEGHSPDSATFVSLLQACAAMGAPGLPEGKRLHKQTEGRCWQDDVVLGGSLINMYVKLGSLSDARNLFDSLPNRNVVTWTTMIAGYAQQGLGQEALSLYSDMQEQGLSPPDSVTYVYLLQACGTAASLSFGKQLHIEINERGMPMDAIVGAALVFMYAECGSMSDSKQVFDSMSEKTIETWNTLMGGYTCQGDSKAVFNLLEGMVAEGIQPNDVTFLCVLTVCSHVGLVDKGQMYFELMSSDYKTSPTIEHYTCMVDLLGRAGLLDQALQVVTTMPFPANRAVWHTLLGACRKWSNVEIGRQAFESAVSLDGHDSASYVLMSNIFARAGMWDEVTEIHARRMKHGAWKKPGESWWPDVGRAVHTFAVSV